MRCENCMFRVKATNDKYPECHRFPPNVLVQKENTIQWNYPLINDLDFCGEFLPNDNLKYLEMLYNLKRNQEDRLRILEKGKTNE